MSYLLPAALALLAAWPAYALLLRYSDRYGLNRLLLVAGMLTICLFPFVELPTPVPAATEIVQESVIYLEDVMPTDAAPVAEATVPVTVDGTTTAVSAAPAPPRSWTWWRVYLGGLALCLVVLGVRMLALLTAHLRSRPNNEGSYRLLHPAAKAGQAYTFGRALYFSSDVPDGPDFDQVLAHERVHARQLHTFDVLLSEIFVCLLWFHPAAWWLRTKVRANLEYLVDKTVVRGGVNRRTYQLALVRQSQSAQALALALPFSEPSLKSRISRMTGLPHHWAVAAVATVAMVFWLGVSALVMLGTPTTDAPPTPTGASIYDEPYVKYFENRLPDQIVSLDIYGRRVPTVDEYYQLRAILQRIPGAELKVYHPEYSPENFTMRLVFNGNFAELPVAITEEASPALTYRLGLLNAQDSEIPFNDATGGRWVTPVAETAVEGNTEEVAKAITGINYAFYSMREDVDFGEGRQRFFSKSWVPSETDLKNSPLPAGEEFVVKVNGRAVPLRPSEKVQALSNDNLFYALDNGQVAFTEWDEATLSPPEREPIPIEKMVGYLGCIGVEDCGVQYMTSDYNGGSYRKIFEGQDLPYYSSYAIVPIRDGEIVDLSTVLDVDYGPSSFFHMGWAKNPPDKDQPIIVVVEVLGGDVMHEVREQMEDDFRRRTGL